ncbi:ABC transporter permease subunit [Bradyrhizobium neotropicale]|uniref:branched-chain amino acid ABC transporter ATP-binding protein/permease n=1 Tax=Bradyrhizobium neotropicale TaxID=1497615 RepID=UPI001AD79372|nr:branched-chain amino acid ABC transporter ATP-binding protein/permease [Bradyrhizobium neotropicale]MBO4226836.1 ATP-binding cassette domain-containing protein [Bradyrhizobium neotropicale]
MNRSFLASIVAVVAALVIATVLPTYYASLAAYAVVLALLGVAVNITVGYLGLISFGHAAFFGLGAYTAGLLATKCGVNFWAATLLAIAPGACLGAIVGFASLRVRGPYFAISTLVTAEILRLIASNWISLTRGPLGVIVARPRISLFESFGLNFAQYHLIISIVALALVLEVLRRLLSSPYGRAWLALRDQQDLAESVGIVPLNHRVAAIGLSGGIAALAGALLVPRILVLSPDLFGTTFSATGLLAAILGGKGTLLGPIFGGMAFAVAPELLRAIDTYRVAVFALLLLIVVRVKPDGLAALLPRSRPKPAQSAAVPPEVQSRRKAADLVISALSKHFGGLKAIDDVSFAVSRGKIVGLIGPNGAGKTTCLSLVSGFLPPTTGRISLGDGQLSGRTAARVAAEGVVRTFQHTTLCPTLSAFENVLIGTHLVLPENPWSAIARTKAFVEREAIRRAWAQACIETVGLTDRSQRDAGTLAYGEQRMLSIAVALAARPDFLLLDEPGAGLNATEAAALAALLRRLRAGGLTIVIIDHNLRMMMALCDELVVLHHGKRLAQGDPLAVRSDPAVVQAYLGEKRSGEANAAA